MSDFYGDSAELLNSPKAKVNRILVVGSGGREHAIIKALIKNTNKNEIICFGNNRNPGIEKYARIVIVDPINIVDVITHLANFQFNFQFAIIGPENPIALGIVNEIEKHGIPCIAPTAEYAKIESNKNFCRTLLEELKPKFDLSPDFKNVKMLDDIINFFSKHKSGVVIKNTGLCGGKGVFVQGDHFRGVEEGISIANTFMNERKDIILEEKLVGDEFSLMTFCDGNGHFKHMPPIQDFKRTFDGNNGPNTGGMGCIIHENNSQPFLSKEDIRFSEQVNEAVAIQLQDKISAGVGLVRGYRGILYGSFMKTKDNRIKVIEYNCRFGDPECLVALHLLKTDFYHLCTDLINGEMTNSVEFSKDACVCKYAVPEGYPNNPMCGYDIYFSDKIKFENLIYAAINEQSNHLYSLTSRTLAYVYADKTVRKAATFVNNEMDYIYGRLYFRKDIGITKYQSVYLNSGVDIEKGNRIVNNIKPYLKITHNDSVGGNLGDFNGMLKVKPADGESDIMLVSSTDGVGTKSIFVREYLQEAGYCNLGQDLVNHCVNDILVSGAHPLFFLDYFASSVVDEKEVVSFVKGVSIACKESNCVLIGGETAEMPDVYKIKRADLVGTIVGQNYESTMINGKQDIREGDIVLALPSNGLHTNGYSLIRKIHSSLIKEPYLSHLMKIHRSYLKEISMIQKENIKINGLCHITGGGLIDNPPRVLPDDLQMRLRKESWNKDNDFYDWIRQVTGTSQEELYRVFNCGLGMLIVASPEHSHKIQELFYLNTISYYNVGVIEKREHSETPVIIDYM